MNKNKAFYIGIIACLIGLAGLVPSTYYWYQARQITQAASLSNEPIVTKPIVVSSPSIATGKPVALSIPSLNLDLAIADGVYNPKTGQWTLSNDKVHYALKTVQPNDKQGNTLIYGHYRPGVFATLKSIKPGSEVYVRTDNGLTFTYTYTGNRVVEPSDGSVFDYQGSPKLTLQTCTGRFMQDRQLFSFDFVNVK